MIKYILLFLTACALITPIYLLIRRPWRFGTGWRIAREWCLGIFTVFMIGLFYMTFRGTYGTPASMFRAALNRIKTGTDIYLVPFKNLIYMNKYDNREHFAMNVLGNTLMFIPWGFFRPLLWKKQQKFARMLNGAVLLTLFIEFVQLFIYRTVDIDDIILNTLGSMTGSGLYALTVYLFPSLNNLAAGSNDRKTGKRKSKRTKNLTEESANKKKSNI